MRAPVFVDAAGPAGAADAMAVRDLVTGLRAPQAAIAPRFLYDGLGSRLFEAITELDEYYPTRTEAAIFDAAGDDIAAALRALLPARFAFVDLGAGNCEKAARWLTLLAPARYVAVDVAADFLRAVLPPLQRRFEAIEMVGVGLDFARALALPPALLGEPALVFYPGSSIGNFDPPAALRLLRQMRETACGGALLAGVDLVKPAAMLEAAYDDALGVTAAFNLNVLRHVNRRLGSDFALRDWQHLARYDAEHARIEMHLRARRALAVRWPAPETPAAVVAGEYRVAGGERRFATGETIHTENSYKWSPAAFERLLGDAGFRQLRCWTDARGWFAVMLASG